MNQQPQTDNPSTVLLKSSQILNALSDAGRGLRFKELQKATKLSNGTLNRLLNHLTILRFLDFNQETSTYSIGTRLMTWAHHALQDLPIKQAATNVLTTLRDQIDETVHLAILDGSHLLYVDKKESTKSIRMYSSIGRTAPLHCTGVGKAILAFERPEIIESVISSLEFKQYTPTTIGNAKDLRKELEQIRKQGYALDNGEHEPEIRCVAAPILNSHGVSIGGISISAPAFRIEENYQGVWAQLVTQSAQTITKNLGWAYNPKA
jgi:IclR family transcriptional regulator, KDG regulon repressor